MGQTPIECPINSLEIRLDAGRAVSGYEPLIFELLRSIQSRDVATAEELQRGQGSLTA
jgi:hypothetical protein